MGSRLLPLSLALAALLADAASLHRLAFYLVLLAVPGAAAAAFVGAGDVLEGKGGKLRAATTILALALLVLGSAARSSAAAGVPALADSTLAAALIAYALPMLAWLFEPLVPRPRQARVRVEAEAG